MTFELSNYQVFVIPLTGVLEGRSTKTKKIRTRGAGGLWVVVIVGLLWVGRFWLGVVVVGW